MCIEKHPQKELYKGWSLPSHFQVTNIYGMPFVDIFAKLVMCVKCLIQRLCCRDAQCRWSPRPQREHTVLLRRLCLLFSLLAGNRTTCTTIGVGHELGGWGGGSAISDDDYTTRCWNLRRINTARSDVFFIYNIFRFKSIMLFSQLVISCTEHKQNFHITT